VQRRPAGSGVRLADLRDARPSGEDQPVHL